MGTADPATITASSFTVTGPGGPVTGTIAYDDSTRTATLTPSAPLAFSTAYTVAHDADFITLPSLLADTCLDPLFRACADSVEQAIVDALWSATSLSGRDGHRRLSLLDAAPDLAQHVP